MGLFDGFPGLVLSEFFHDLYLMVGFDHVADLKFREGDGRGWLAREGDRRRVEGAFDPGASWHRRPSECLATP